MDRAVIEESIANIMRNTDLPKIDETVLKEFKEYFSNTLSASCSENVISDESLFRDYSRIGNRKVDFARVRNPFTISKYTLSSYEKTWYVKRVKGNKIDGPYNSYEMDELFKKGKITKPTQIGISKEELFEYKRFIEVVYPLPKAKNNYNGPGSNIKGVQMMQSANKFTRLYDGTDKKSRQGSVISDKERTPFKRTPFKVMPNEIVKVQTIIRENFTPMNSESKIRSFSSQKKMNQPKYKSQIKGVDYVGERFLVKSKKQNKTKFQPRSSKANFKLEMNDIIGNYTAIKRDGDEREYVDLSKKIDFKKGAEEVELDQISISGDDFSFDDLEVHKKD